MVKWSYSKVPKMELKWDIVEDHWIDLVVEGNDISYIGTDWTIQSGGGYMAGYQTADQFLKKGPIPHNEMPDEIKTKVISHLEKYRIAGGSSLEIIHISEVEDGILKNCSYYRHKVFCNLVGITKDAFPGT